MSGMMEHPALHLPPPNHTACLRLVNEAVRTTDKVHVSTLVPKL